MTSSIKFQIGIIETEGIAEKKVKKEGKKHSFKKAHKWIFLFFMEKFEIYGNVENWPAVLFEGSRNMSHRQKPSLSLRLFYVHRTHAGAGGGYHLGPS